MSEIDALPCIKRGMVETLLGSIAYHIISEGEIGGDDKEDTIVCLHSSPRSSDEFVDIMPHLFSNDNGKTRTIIALDCPGYGNSENPIRSCTLEEIGIAYLHLLRKLNLIDSNSIGERQNDDDDATRQKRIILFGSLMGNFIALSIASRYPELISSCILVNLYYFPTKKDTYEMPKISAAETNSNDDEDKKNALSDSWELTEDGSMLSKLFTKRPWAGNELNLRIVHSEITYLMNRRKRYKQGITIEDLSDANLELPARKTTCPVLCVKGKASMDFLDMIGLQGTQQFDSAVTFLQDLKVEVLEGVGSNINLVNQMPNELAQIINEFLAG